MRSVVNVPRNSRHGPNKYSLTGSKPDHVKVTLLLLTVPLMDPS